MIKDKICAKSRNRRKEHITILVENVDHKSAKIIQKNLRQAIQKINHLSQKKISYQINISVNDSEE